MSPPTVETKTRPILFGAPMVRAILDGSKTQTRRIIRRSNSLLDGGPWPASARLHLSTAIVDRGPSPAGNPGPYLNHVALSEGWGDTFHRIYSRVQIGDLWWVRETLRHGYTGKHSRRRLHYAADERPVLRIPKTATPMTRVTLPSIFMPRWASRITLEVTEVRVERVQAISASDALFEGIEFEYVGQDQESVRRRAFANLWDSINAKRGLGWAVNPWCWCVTFRRVKP